MRLLNQLKTWVTVSHFTVHILRLSFIFCLPVVRSKKKNGFHLGYLVTIALAHLKRPPLQSIQFIVLKIHSFSYYRKTTICALRSPLLILFLFLTVNHFDVHVEDWTMGTNPPLRCQFIVEPSVISFQK